jgi:fructuronate reductase
VIVHLGLGAFHRAHQAVYTEDAGGWEICGVAWRRRTVVDALRANRWRYTVISRGPERDEAREIGVIRDALVATDEPDAVVERIAAADIVTLTITEGAYERGGMLDLLALGIARRAAPLTVISCDNVPRNGEVLRDVLGSPPDVAFPCTMVDRIVPTPDDPLTVVAEPFSQWVIERFPGPRPAWPGVQIVENAAPHEAMKLRLLNGSHTALAALGLPKGHETVADAIADPELAGFLRRLLDEELIPTVAPELDPEGYAETMLERFRNPRIEHRLEQIATGAEHKIAQRLLPVADELRAAGREPELINRVVRRALR